MQELIEEREQEQEPSPEREQAQGRGAQLQLQGQQRGRQTEAAAHYPPAKPPPTDEREANEHGLTRPQAEGR